jgi:hypothetical protein
VPDVKRNHDHKGRINKYINRLIKGGGDDVENGGGRLVDEREMKKMKDHEGQDEDARIGHGPGTQGPSSGGGVQAVTDGPGVAVEQKQIQSGQNMHQRKSDQTGAEEMEHGA